MSIYMRFMIATTIAFTILSSGSVVVWSTDAFVPSVNYNRSPCQLVTGHDKTTLSKQQRLDDQQLQMVGGGGGDERFSREVRLRAEAESPFRKVRFFLYISLAGSALTSLAVSVARIAAGLSGINADLLDESLLNAGVDIAGLVVIGFAYKRDAEAEESRLKSATKGAELAKLTIRASKSLVDDLDSSTSSDTFTTTLSSLRRGRGIEKRVVIAAGGKDKIIDVIKQARELNDDLMFNDLVVVPVVMPRGEAPSNDMLLLQQQEQEEENDDNNIVPTSIALPVVVGGNWKTMLDDEAIEAVKQGVDIEKDGFVIVLKKNGKVGQRTKGIYLNNLVGNVEARRNAGMDVANI